MSKKKKAFNIPVEKPKKTNRGLGEVFSVDIPKEEAPTLPQDPGLDNISLQEALAIYELVKAKLDGNKQNKIRRAKKHLGGRPKSSTKVQYGFRIEGELLQRLRVYAKYSRVDVTEVIVNLIKAFVDENYKPSMDAALRRRKGN